MFLCVDYICAYFFLFTDHSLYIFLLYSPISNNVAINPHSRSNDNIPTMYWVGVSLAVHRINKPFVYFQKAGYFQHNHCWKVCEILYKTPEITKVFITFFMFLVATRHSGLNDCYICFYIVILYIVCKIMFFYF